MQVGKWGISCCSLAKPLIVPHISFNDVDAHYSCPMDMLTLFLSSALGSTRWPVRLFKKSPGTSPQTRCTPHKPLTSHALLQETSSAEVSAQNPRWRCRAACFLCCTWFGRQAGCSFCSGEFRKPSSGLLWTFANFLEWVEMQIFMDTKQSSIHSG